MKCNICNKDVSDIEIGRVKISNHLTVTIHIDSITRIPKHFEKTKDQIDPLCHELIFEANNLIKRIKYILKLQKELDNDKKRLEKYIEQINELKLNIYIDKDGFCHEVIGI